MAAHHHHSHAPELITFNALDISGEFPDGNARSLILKARTGSEMLLEGDLPLRIESARAFCSEYPSRTFNCLAFVRHLAGVTNGLTAQFPILPLGEPYSLGSETVINFPSVLQIIGSVSHDIGEMPGYEWETWTGVAHAAVIIGKDSKNGEYIAIDKRGREGAIQFSSLQEMVSFYSEQFIGKECSLRLATFAEVIKDAEINFPSFS